MRQEFPFDAHEFVYLHLLRLKLARPRDRCSGVVDRHPAGSYLKLVTPAAQMHGQSEPLREEVREQSRPDSEHTETGIGDGARRDTAFGRGQSDVSNG